MINQLLRGLLAFTLLLGSTELFTQSKAHAAYATAFRVKETTTTTGTGTLNLGGAPAGYQTFVAGIGNGNTCSYFIFDSATGAWERGLGTVTDATPDTLARTTCLSNSSHTEPSKINFSAGTKYVYVHEGDAFTLGTLAQFGATTSAQLFSVISDESGSGVVAGTISPTFTTPNLGTPSTLTLTNATGLTTAGLVNDAVTYAKIQNISATSRVLGRKTSGAGDTEEVTLSELLDFIGSAAQGDILFRGSSGWSRLGTGTSGYFLKAQGAGADLVWAAIPGGGDALTSNPLSQFAATTSLQLKGVISDESGSGALVFATSPTLVTPLLGTPTSGDLTNCTNYPVASLSGLGTGVATFLATPSSANLASAITNETGSGALVFATSPTLVTPALGTPSALVLTNATGAVTATYTDDSVTYAKIQNVSAASKLLGRGSAGGAGDTEEITLGSGLSMTGTTLSASGSGTVIPSTNDFRVTTESGVSVSTSDRTSQGTIYLTPHKGKYIALYVSSVWTYLNSAEVSLALSGLTSGKNYDIYAYSNSGTLTLELSAAWTNDTTRADAYALQDGVYVKSSDHSRRLVGVLRTTGTTTTEDSNAKRFLINLDNKVPIVSKQFDTTDSWTNAGNGTWSAMNSGNAAWKFEMIFPLGIEYVQAEAYVTHTNGIIAIGLDTTTTPDRAKTTYGTCSVSGGLYGVTPARYSEAPALGYHYVQTMQTTWSATTQTFYGDNGAGFSGSIAGNAGMFVTFQK